MDLGEKACSASWFGIERPGSAHHRSDTDYAARKPCMVRRTEFSWLRNAVVVGNGNHGEADSSNIGRIRDNRVVLHIQTSAVWRIMAWCGHYQTADQLVPIPVAYSIWLAACRVHLKRLCAYPAVDIPLYMRILHISLGYRQAFESAKGTGTSNTGTQRYWAAQSPYIYGPPADMYGLGLDNLFPIPCVIAYVNLLMNIVMG